MADVVVDDGGADVGEGAALEEALAVGVPLDGVSVVVLPDAVDGVEQGAAGQGGAAT